MELYLDSGGHAVGEGFDDLDSGLDDLDVVVGFTSGVNQSFVGGDTTEYVQLSGIRDWIVDSIKKVCGN